MDIKDLRFFCTTAELEHVTKAADKLCISQPFLTKIIGDIEKDIGTKLFDKAGKNIKINRSGEVFYNQAKRILAEVDNLYTEMDYELERKERSSSLLCNTEAYAARLVESFHKTNMPHSLVVKYTSKQEMIEALNRSEADFALCSPPIDDNDYTNLKTEIVLSDVGCVMLPPDHPLLKKDTIMLSDLEGIPLSTNLKGGAMRSKLDQIFESYNFHPQIDFESYSISMIIRSVMCGKRYAFLTWLLVDDYPEIRQYCRKIDIPNNNIIGVFGLTYSRVEIANRYNESFRSFAVNFLRDLQYSLSLPM